MVHLSVLTDDEVEAVHQATLRILSQVGVVLTHPAAREVLIRAGAVERDERVFIPAVLVEETVAGCPSRVNLRGRNGKTVVLGDGSLHWHNLGGAREIYDPRTGGRRPALLQDLQDAVRVLDALDAVTSVTPFYTPQDVPGPLMSLAMVRHTLSHTVKPVHGPGVQTAREVRYMARMAAAIGPLEEMLSLSVSPVSPLTFPDGAAEAMMEAARLGIPLGPLPCPIAGGTAPLSLAGALAQQNAEVLASIVLAQRVRPGLPVFYCGRLAMMDPRTGLSVWGGVEVGLASAATVQIGHRYGLPVNVYGFSTNAHSLDMQSGYERALNAAIPALAGADELSGVGEMGAGVMGSHSQMVCDSEIAASIQRLRRGFATDEEALAVEVVAAVMDGARHFLGQRHTARYLRAGECLLPRLAERGTWGEWERLGRQGFAERARAEAERLLSEHQVPPLTENQERELDKVLQEAERELA